MFFFFIFSLICLFLCYSLCFVPSFIFFLFIYYLVIYPYLFYSFVVYFFYFMDITYIFYLKYKMLFMMKLEYCLTRMEHLILDLQYLLYSIAKIVLSSRDKHLLIKFYLDIFILGTILIYSL